MNLFLAVAGWVVVSFAVLGFSILVILAVSKDEPVGYDPHGFVPESDEVARHRAEHGDQDTLDGDQS